MTDFEQVLKDSGVTDRLTILNTAASELSALCEQINKKMEKLAAMGVSINIHVTDGADRIDREGRHRTPPYIRPETFMVLKG